MADNVPITPGSGATIATDEVTDATLGTVQVQFLKLMDGTLNSTNKAVVTSAGEVKINGIVNTNLAGTVVSGTTWTSSTSVNTTLALSPGNNNVSNSIVGSMTTTSTITAGAITFEESFDQGNTYVAIPVSRLINPSTGAQLTNPYTLIATTKQPYQIVPSGATLYQARLSIAITGTGNLTWYNYAETLPTAMQVFQPSGGNLNVTSRSVGAGGGTFDFASTQNIATPGQAILIGGEFNTTPTTITSGNSSPLQLDASGSLKVSAAPTVQSNWGIGTDATTFTIASNGFTPIGGFFQTGPTNNPLTNGQMGVAQLTVNRSLFVNLRDNSGAVIGVGSNALTCQGDIASGATDAGNPQKMGGVGKTTNPTAVTDGQRVAAIFDKLGKQVVVGAVRDLKGVQTTSITAATETTIVTAAGSGVFADVYGITLANTSATAVNVAIKDATAGTTRVTIQVPAGDTRGFMLPVDSAIPQATANNNWTATVSSAVTSMLVTALYVKNT